jgi:hypothetical protein
MRTVGYACGVLAVALIIFSIWASGVGAESGMTSLGLALALLLVAELTLRADGPRA